MRKRLRHMRRDEGGSVLVMIAILLPVMLGMGALAIDVAGWYQTRRQLQSAADAAALAGMQDLPTSATASTDAQNYVIKNASGAGTTVTTPFNSDSNQIKVTVTKSYPSIFGGLLGLGSVQISASAVAKKTGTGSSKSALFASNTACGGTNGVYIVSNNVNVIGGTHSNGNLYLNANNDQLGPTSYGGPNGCSYSNYGNNNTFGGPGTPIQDPNTEGWPEDFIANPPTCTNTASSFSWSGNNITIPPGVYCATGSSGITITGNNIVGNGVTFKASTFSLTGNNFAMTAAFQDLLFYYTGTGAFSIDGNNLTGQTIFAPNGTISITGNNGTSSGFVEGKNVQINGNNLTFTGTGPPTPGFGSTMGALTQ